MSHPNEIKITDDNRDALMAGAEVFACASKHNDFHRVVVNSTPKTCVQGIGHLGILDVVKIWPVHGERGDTISHRVQNGLLSFVNSVVFTLYKLIAGVRLGHGAYPIAVARRL